MFKEFLSKWRYRQYLYCIIAILTASVGVIHSSWSSPMVPLLKSDDSPIGVTLTTVETSLVVSLYNGGYVVGNLLTVRANDLIGRKILLIGGTFLEFVSWFFICFARSAILLYIGRIIAGIGSIICSHIAAMYIAEMADIDNRGKIGFLLVILNNFFPILGYTVGPFMSYIGFAIMSAVATLCSLVFVLFIPESPFFLTKKHKYEEAENLLWKLTYGQQDKEFVQKKMETIVKSVENEMLNKGSISELFFSGKYKKHLLLHFGLSFTLYFSGVTLIQSYLLTILEETGSSISSDVSSVIFGIVQLATSFVTGEVVDRLGRRPLLIVSCSVTSLATFSLALYFYIKEKTDYSIDQLSWIPLTCMILFKVFTAVGILSIPGLVVAELYPINIKGMAYSTVSTIVSAVGMGLQFSFEPLNEIWGIYTTFWVFCGFTILGVLFAVFILPETKGKTFAEIQMAINPGKNVDIDHSSQLQNKEDKV